MKLRNGSKRTPFKDLRPKNRGSRTCLDRQAVHRFLLNILNWISNRYQFSCACRSVGGGFVSVVSLFSKWKSAFVFKELWFKFNRSHFQKRTLWRQFLGLQGPVLSFFQNWQRWHRCWWRMLETKCVGDKFKMLMTDSRCWWPIYYSDKITNKTKKVANIMNLSPTS